MADVENIKRTLATPPKGRINIKENGTIIIIKTSRNDSKQAP